MSYSVAINQGFLVDHILVEKASTIADFCVETVAFTYFLFQSTVEFPKIENQLLRNKAVQEEGCQSYV